MNGFDLSILHFLNSFAHRSWIADAMLGQIADNVFLDGAVLMAMFWWAWIEYGKKDPQKREVLAADLGVCALAVVLARMLALSLPFRERPIRNPLLHFTHPFNSDPHALIHWSSFPSDHAVLAFCIATGLWMVSRRLGTLALAYAFVTNVPRIYAGIHYPTDFIAGALLGVAMASLSGTPTFRNAARTCLDFLDPYPAYLYVLLFGWTFEISEMFSSLRRIAVLAAKSLMRLPAREVNALAIPLLVMLLGLLVWRRRRRRKAHAAGHPFSSHPAQ
jgi:undecaprenyl-diphosphatase